MTECIKDILAVGEFSLLLPGFYHSCWSLFFSLAQFFLFLFLKSSKCRFTATLNHMTDRHTKSRDRKVDLSLVEVESNDTAMLAGTWETPRGQRNRSVYL